MDFLIAGMVGMLVGAAVTWAYFADRVRELERDVEAWEAKWDDWMEMHAATAKSPQNRL